MFEPIINFIKGLQKKDKENSKEEAKKRLQLVLMQDRASVSPDFFEMMKKEIIEVIKKYIEIDEEALEVQLTRGFEDGLEGPALYANIPIKNIKPIAKKVEMPKEEVLEEETEEKEAEETNAEKPAEEVAESEEKVAEETEKEEAKIEEKETETEEKEEPKAEKNEDEKQTVSNKPKSKGKKTANSRK